MKKIFFIALFLVVFGSLFNFVLNQPEKSSLSEENSQLKLKYPLRPDYPPVFYAKKDGHEAAVLYFEPSLYGQVAVFDDAGGRIRCLMIDGSNQGCWDWEYKMAVTYVRDVRKFLANFPKEKEDILVIGLGASSLLKELETNGLVDFKIDVVDINPEVVAAAEKFFVLPENLDYKVFIDDGRHFLRNVEKEYDIIILDLCEIVDSNAHLWTKEFYSLVDSKLKSEDGVLIVTLNSFRSVDAKKTYQLVAETLKEEFAEVFTVDRHKDNPNTWGMILFFSSQKPLGLPEIEDFPIEQWDFGNSFPSITDDNAPKTVQYYFPIFEKLRNDLVQYFGPAILLGP